MCSRRTASRRLSRGPEVRATGAVGRTREEKPRDRLRRVVFVTTFARRRSRVPTQIFCRPVSDTRASPSATRQQETPSTFGSRGVFRRAMAATPVPRRASAGFQSRDEPSVRSRARRRAFAKSLHGPGEEPAHAPGRRLELRPAAAAPSAAARPGRSRAAAPPRARHVRRRGGGASDGAGSVPVRRRPRRGPALRTLRGGESASRAERPRRRRRRPPGSLPPAAPRPWGSPVPGLPWGGAGHGQRGGGFPNRPDGPVPKIPRGRRARPDFGSPLSASRRGVEGSRALASAACRLGVGVPRASSAIAPPRRRRVSRRRGGVPAPRPAQTPSAGTARRTP